MIKFTEPKNEIAYAKLGIFGSQGAGKSTTAALIAIGLWKYIQTIIKDPRPVLMLDSETGSDWLAPIYKQNKVPFQVSKTRKFSDLVEAMLYAAENASILTIDSVTHFWDDMIFSYRKAKRITGSNPLWIWQPLKKEEWPRFSIPFVNSPLHIIACGRAGNIYRSERNEDGKLEFFSEGTKFRAEGEFGYESHLLFEMSVIRGPNPGDKTIHRATVLKDRVFGPTSLDGKCFDNPTFKDFLPHFKAINIGGKHLGFEEGTSEDMFKPNGNGYSVRKQQQIVLMEELNGTLEMHYPGTKQEAKIAKSALKKWAFKTYSDTEISEMPPSLIQERLGIVLDILNMDEETRNDYINNTIIPALKNAKNRKEELKEELVGIKET